MSLIILAQENCVRTQIHQALKVIVWSLFKTCWIVLILVLLARVQS